VPTPTSPAAPMTTSSSRATGCTTGKCATASWSSPGCSNRPTTTDRRPSRPGAHGGQGVAVGGRRAQALEERGRDRRIDLEGDAPEQEAVDDTATDAHPRLVT